MKKDRISKAFNKFIIKM